MIYYSPKGDMSSDCDCNCHIYESVENHELQELRKRVAELCKLTATGWSVTGTETQLKTIESFIKEKIEIQTRKH
jgi:hypothetical protein